MNVPLLRSRHTYNSSKMDKVYLRLIPETEQFDITFQYRNADKRVDRQFNFCRKLSESVGTFLGRVTTNLEKALNKKKSNKKKDDAAVESNIPIVVSLMLNGSEVCQEVECRSVFQEDNRVVFKLFDVNYDVIINSPFVNRLALPQSTLANFIVYPSAFETTYTDKALTSFEWYKSSDKKEWIKVGEGFTYEPTNNEIDHFLKLKCTPRNEKHEGLTVEALMGSTVSASPGTCPFETRHMFTKERTINNEFRVVSYNILADLYCDSDFTRTVLHPYCPAYALTLDYRKQLVMKELIGYNADIICLQEVDTKVYNYDLRPLFGSLGYTVHFTRKGGDVNEGLACIYNERKFRLVKENGVILSKVLKVSAVLSDILACASSKSNLLERLCERQNAFQVTVLESVETGNLLVVGNTHLYFHPDADHIRLLQAGMCIRLLEETMKELSDKYSDKLISTIFCGDFNSVPECGIFKLYTTGSVGSDCVDWRSNENEAISGFSLEQPMKFGSACGTPKYTNYTSGFADCLDYIFYDTDKLDVTQVVPLPSNEELMANTALPSIVFPSDHLAQVADLKWIACN